MAIRSERLPFAVLVKFVGVDLWLGLVATLLLGAILGMLNGFLTAYLRIPAFITTLAALSAFGGIAFMFNNGSPVLEVSPLMEQLFYGSVLGLPLPLIYVLAFFAPIG